MIDEPDKRVVEPLAVVRDYDGLRAAVATRRKELGLTQLDLDDAAGLQTGYASKLEAGIKNYGPMSLTSTLDALGLELAVIRRKPHQTTLARLPSHETIERRRKWWNGGDQRTLPAPEPAE